MRGRLSGKPRQLTLVEESPLRHADPRTKLFISLAISLVVMTSLERLVIFLCMYFVFLLWARLLMATLEPIWRLKWVLVFLFAIDWWLIGMEHAALICLRLALLSGVFALFFSTTNTRELGLALEKLGAPYRYAFSLSLAFQSLSLLGDEWRTIREAQVSRGGAPETSSFWKLITHVGDLISLTVPAIVLTTKRAWAVTEAAYARGFDSPRRASYHTLAFTQMDVRLAIATTIVLTLLFWRW